MGFMEKLQAKLELYRLEQRYTKRTKRTTFISDATYVDGEYVYGYSSPSSPKSASSAGSWGRKGPSVTIKQLKRQSRIF